MRLILSPSVPAACGPLGHWVAAKWSAFPDRRLTLLPYIFDANPNQNSHNRNTVISKPFFLLLCPLKLAGQDFLSLTQELGRFN